jgi:hypothetical protein
MSRHLISAPGATTEIIVGYDAPLATYFAQIIELGALEAEAADDDRTTFWVGTSRGEIKTVAELQKHLEPFAEIPALVLSVLELDRAAEECEPTPLQKMMHNFVTG